MKTIIAGGRDYEFNRHDILALDMLSISMPITEVVSGCAKGADTCGEQWAEQEGIPVMKFPAEWDKYGKAAGHKRNEVMAQYADAVILFPGGKGTANMEQNAIKYNLKIIKP